MIKNEPTDIKQLQEKYYGIYRGVVEQNDDGDHQDGRVQIRIWGIHTKKNNVTDTEGIPTSELPWAQPAYPIVEGSISGIGLWSVPVQGTHVFVFFENGDHMQPRYFACAPGIQPSSVTQNANEGFYDPDKVYPTSSSLGSPDMCEEARNYYPYNTVVKTQGGISIELDSSPGARRIKATHPQITTIEMKENGDIDIINSSTTGSNGDINILALKDINLISSTGNGNFIVPLIINITATTVFISSSTYLGGASVGGASTKALATEDHVHSGVQKGNDNTGLPSDVTTNTWAV